jgi:hypothetical protein
MTWWNWLRGSPRAAKPPGQRTTMPLRVPSQCEAMILLHSKPSPVGHRSNGPEGLVSHGGVWCILPNAPVLYSFIRRICAIVAHESGRIPV